MYNSTRPKDSLRSFKPNDTITNLNGTSNGLSSFIQPKITSTPLQRRESVLATPPKPHILSSPRKYSLSEIATPPKYLNKRDSYRSLLTQNTTGGPLLGSTPYKVNLSTYIDVKSPGLVGRAIQYHEESERPRPTHQQKYGSPGLFPIVHLFKKELPTLALKPKKTTVHIASPEYSRYNSLEYNRLLMDTVTKPNLVKRSHSTPNVHEGSTRSVLDALKEISRKRLHASEEFDLKDESGKRLRTDCLDKTNKESNKRYREDDSQIDSATSPNGQVSKRICMYDEYAASCSSMDFSTLKPASKRKTISSPLEVNPKESKQVKLITVETQTPAAELPKKLVEKAQQVDSDVDKHEEIDSESEDEKLASVKVFDEISLERIRKNRLSALLGTLASKDITLAPKPLLNDTLSFTDTVDSGDKLDEKSEEKELVSILSIPNKSLSKLEKHVTFSLPEQSLSSVQEKSADTPPLSTSMTAVFSSVAPLPIITTPPTFSFGSPSTAVTKSPIVNEKLVTPTPSTSPVNFEKPAEKIDIPTTSVSASSSSNSFLISKALSNTTTVASDSSKNSFTDLLAKPSVSTENFASLASSSSSINSVSNAAIPSFNFGSTPTTTTTNATKITFGVTAPITSSVTNVAPTVTSPPKMGGFKFDLAKPAVSAATSTPAPLFGTSITNPSTNPSVTPSTTAPLFGAPITSISTTPSVVKPMFGTNPTTTLPSTGGATFGQNLASGGFSFAPKTVISTAGAVPTSEPKSVINFSTPNLGSSAPTTTNSNSAPTPQINFAAPNLTFKFGSGAPTASDTKPMFNASNPVSSAFVTKTTASSFPNFSNGAPANTTVPTFTSTIPSTTNSSTFGVPSKPSTFSVAPSAFGTETFTTTMPPPSFNFTTSTVSSANPAVAFPTPTTSAPVFNMGNKPTFGAVTSTTPSSFPSSATPSFGVATSAAPFGSSNTSFGSPTFGTPTTTVGFTNNTTTNNLVSATPSASFGVASSTTPAFGSVPPTTTSGNIFGSNTSSFGKVGGFGATSNNIFASPTTQAPTFAANSKPLFGGSTPFGAPTATTTAAPTFGSNNSGFGTVNSSFGAKTTTITFGTSNSFGTTTTAASTFGTSTTPKFGTSNSFGGSGTTSFGSNSFSSSASSAFGGSTGSVFGGGGNGTNGGNNNPPPAFGANTNAFSAQQQTPSSSLALPNNSNNTFGAGIPSNSVPSAFSKPQNNFETPTPAFGTNNSFGGQNQAGFGATTSTQNQGGVFNFGSGSVAPKPGGVFAFGGSVDPPKPSFNFTGGAAAPPAFGSNTTATFGGAAPSFGGSAAPQAFAAPNAAPGTFSIGAGPPAGRQRAQLKAKRRT